MVSPVEPEDIVKSVPLSVCAIVAAGNKLELGADDFATYVDETAVTVDGIDTPV